MRLYVSGAGGGREEDPIVNPVSKLTHGCVYLLMIFAQHSTYSERIRLLSKINTPVPPTPDLNTTLTTPSDPKVGPPSVSYF